jgi:CheY-like chemotaxis protein
MAKNGLEAVNFISQKNWDVIFMDLHMPELDGMGAVIKIRNLGSQIKQPWIIALTADAYETTKKECFAVGMNDFITKPVTKNSLSDALSKVKVSKS